MASLLSSKLYGLAKSKAAETLDYNKRHCFVWIWYWLFVNQPKNVLRKELEAVENAADALAFKSHYILELAWKAEALEMLLES
jgi:hypothetical protein